MPREGKFVVEVGPRFMESENNFGAAIGGHFGERKIT
jgi:hypothetical protein